MSIVSRCVKLQSLPFFPQTSTIAPVWSSSISYCDPGMVSFYCCFLNISCDGHFLVVFPLLLHIVRASITDWWMPCFSCSRSYWHTHTHTQPFYGLWSGTTRVGRYQKKHSPTHAHPDHRTSVIIFLHLQRSMASSLFSLRA